MTAEQLFSMVNLLALLSWVALAALPRVSWVARVVSGVAVPAILSAVYVALLVTQWGTGGGFSTLDAVARLFANPWLLLAGWTHYLAFDLLVGSWEVQDARRLGIPHLLVLPCLFLTFMVGPAGWLVYQAVRYGHRARGPGDGHRRSPVSQ
jgi:ABA DEFICIENT 4-like